MPRKFFDCGAPRITPRVGKLPHYCLSAVVGGHFEPAYPAFFSPVVPAVADPFEKFHLRLLLALENYLKAILSTIHCGDGAGGPAEL